MKDCNHCDNVIVLDEDICNACMLQDTKEHPVVLHKLDKEIQVQTVKFGGKFKAAKLKQHR
jgi:hypothetical protein